MRVFLPCLLYLSIFANESLAQCESGELQRQFTERAESLSDVTVEVTKPMEPVIASVRFEDASIFATDYSCRNKRTVDYDAFVAYAWVIELSVPAQASVLSIRDALSNSLRNFGEVQVIEDTLLNIETGEEIRIRSSIDFYLEHIEKLDKGRTPKLIVSGPFMRPTQIGEEAIGLLLTETQGMLNRYRDFSARHVLCFAQGEVDLFERSWIAAREGLSAAQPELIDRTMDRVVQNECDNAIQVGPTFWERSVAANSRGRPGISGLSLRSGRRNVFFKIAEGDSLRTFLVSTISGVSSFETMVLVHAISNAISEESQLIWAVGLQDENFLSGPVLVDRGAVMRLAPTDIPTGAILVFE